MTLKTRSNEEMKVCKNQWIVFVLLALAFLAATYIVKNRSLDFRQIQTTESTSTIVGYVAVGGAQQDSQIKVEVYHFHGTNQCWSCRTMGALAEKTVKTHFKDELESRRLIFSHVNYDLPENRELLAKYGVYGSSLWIGTYVNGVFHREENVQVWYKLNNEDGYISYLKDILDKRLSGDLN